MAPLDPAHNNSDLAAGPTIIHRADQVTSPTATVRRRLTQRALTPTRAQAARRQVMAAQRTAVLQMAKLAETPLVAVPATVRVLEMENLLTRPAAPLVVTLVRAQVTADQVTADQTIAAVLRMVPHQERWGKQGEVLLLPAGPVAAAVRLPWARL